MAPKRKKLSGRNSGSAADRPLRSFSRRQGRKRPSKTLVIVCEGEKTEPLYFRALRNRYRLSTVTIEIVEGQGSPVGVVQKAKKRRDELSDKEDEVWCVFDRETAAESTTFQRAIELSRSARIRLAVSNPAFEYWYILHFECTDRPFRDAQDAFDRLEGHLPGYDKAVPVFDRLEQLIPAAIQNAEQLRLRATESWDTFPNPSTGVDRLVLEIRRLVDDPC